VRVVNAEAIDSSVISAVSGSTSSHRSATPADSAACTHGRTFASWSSRETTTSSPSRHVAAIAREMS